MCQLLGMNCNTPTDIRFSFSGFRRRGGDTDHHTDGFGIAFFEEMACQTSTGFGLRLYHDDRPCVSSPVADLINAYPIRARTVVAHIRKATTGGNCLANTHPFVREVWGEPWVFAHNGQMSAAFIAKNRRLAQNGNAQFYRPVGSTDSELAFCYLLNRLRRVFKTRPDNEALFRFLTAQCRYLSANGLFNVLISNGKWQLAYASTLLFHITRQAPFGRASLYDGDIDIDFSTYANDGDRVTVLVTLPLTDEPWQQLAVNECIVFADGKPIFNDCPEPAVHLTIGEGMAMARAVGASM